MNPRIYKFYLRLSKKYPRPPELWQVWCQKKKSAKLKEEIAIGAILTQRTNWRNVEQALANLKKTNILSLKKISRLKNLEKLKNLIKPAGFYQTKSKRLYEFCRFLQLNYGSLINFTKEDLKTAREKLLALYGIGPETADSILLYALDKPTFVIDEYTRRFVKKNRLAKKFTYDYLKNLFEKNLPCDVELYQKYHALIVWEGKKT